MADYEYSKFDPEQQFQAQSADNKPLNSSPNT